MTTAAIPINEPSEITIGETLKWRKTLAGYQASDGWELKYYFRGAGNGLDIEGSSFVVADGNSWLVTIPAESVDADPSTSNLTAGIYYWQAWVTKGAERYLVDGGQLVVKPNLFDPEIGLAFDGRSENEAMLGAVKLALGKVAAKNTAEYSIAGRMKRQHSIADLIVLHDRLVGLVNQERQAEALRKGSPFLTNIYTRFR